MAHNAGKDIGLNDHYAELSRVRAGELPSFSLAMEVVLDLAGQQIPDPEDCDNTAAENANQADADHTLLSDLLSNFGDEIDGIVGETPVHPVPAESEQLPSRRLLRMIDLASQGVIDDPQMGDERRLQDACIKRMREFVSAYGWKIDSIVSEHQTPAP